MTSSWNYKMKDKNITTVTTLMKLIESCYNKGLSIGETRVELQQYNLDIALSNKEQIVEVFLDKLWQHKEGSENMELEGVVIYEGEINFLSKIKSPFIRKAMFLFLLEWIINYHPSNWIAYQKEKILQLLLGSLSPSERRLIDKEWIIQECHKNGLELRVVGQKNPIICFNLNFVSKVGEQVNCGDFTEISQLYYHLFKEKWFE